MELGIFTRTFPTRGALPTLRAVAASGFTTAQFNLACLDLPSMPDQIETEDVATVATASIEAGVSIAAVSGTYNMAHPDAGVRRRGLERLGVLCGACATIGTRMVTLCTGTRDPDDQWRWHPDNTSKEAWRDLVTEIAAAVRIAEQFDVVLGIEPERANIISSPTHARLLLDQLHSTRIRIILDPANLFDVATDAERRTIVERAVDVLAGDLAMAHAKDRDASGNIVAAGSGVIDFRHFVTHLRRAQFNGPLVTHDLTETEAPGVAIFLTGILAEDR
jgi:sugar phosphate isomerase/epimerase